MKPSLKVTGIDHVVLHVKDLARAKKFYVDFLGMKVAHESSWQSFLKCGDQVVALFEVDEGAEIHGGSEMNHMALRLEAGDYQTVKAALEKAGFKVSGRRGDPRCIYFNDPDGHRLQLLTPEEWQ
ncbi:MAG TPA: VOC family protein [Candidatus Acidoferrales bacterium]|nr:VOC family protein [Candidatus Acidoferrales bacterium]